MPTGAYLCAGGVGVTNLEASVTFYKALGMKEKARLKRAGRDEVVMVSADARGSQLVLYTQTDGTTPNYQQNPGKIVFYVKDATAFSVALTAAGGTLSSPPVPYQGRMVGFGRDLDKNLVEIASDATVTHSYISAFGVGVADLEAAKTFYVDTLDMKVLVKLSVTKPNGMGGTTPWYDEYILQSTAGKGSAVVLMQYTDGLPKNYANNPVKLVYRVDDPAAYMQRIATSGKTVVRQAVPSSEPALGGAVAPAAKDADGTLIEIFKSPQVEACAPLAAPVPASGAAAPVSASGAYMCSAGLGVSNLEASATFYKTAFGMTERSRITRVGRNEIVLDSADRRGSQLVLFTYTDGSSRNYKQTPGKVVFYVKDTAVTVAAVNALGGQASVPVAYQGRQVSFGQDPDGTLVEITSEPTAVVAYLSAYGIGVSNLEAAKDFYVNTLDMKVLIRLSVTKAPNTPWYDEYILTSKAGRGSAIVLMTYTDGSAKNYANNPVKLGMRVNQPGAYARSIYDIGKPVLSAPRAAPEAVLGDALVGYATDADGSLLEILSSPN
jgi:catechol 2,3-dioxygenase-like lactoylglutathione lyase family enzyme